MRTSSCHAAVELNDVPASHPRETIKRGARFISPKVGLVRTVGHGVYHSQDAATFGLGIMSSDLSRFSSIANTSKGGGGGEQLEAAIAATIGEAAERYCMFFYDKQAMVLAPYREVEAHAPSPELLRLYSREQVANPQMAGRVADFDENTVIRWVWGWSLTDDRPRLVPASLTYLNYVLSEGEQTLGRNASTGLAAGLTIEEAIRTAIYECVERDAFTIGWLHRQFGRRIVVDDAELLDVMRSRFYSEHKDIDIAVYDITLDIPITTTFLTMRRPSELGPALCVGTAARLDPKAAVRKCLHEAGQALPYFRFLLGQLKGWQPAEDFSDVTSFDLHCILYIKRPQLVAPALAFADAVTTQVTLSAVPNRATGRVLGDILAALEILRARGFEVIVVDITTPDVEAVGLKVVRVLIPGLVNLHGNHNFPYLGAARLHNIPATMGWPTTSNDFNQFPHPFP